MITFWVTANNCSRESGQGDITMIIFQACPENSDGERSTLDMIKFMPSATKSMSQIWMGLSWKGLSNLPPMIMWQGVHFLLYCIRFSVLNDYLNVLCQFQSAHLRIKPTTKCLCHQIIQHARSYTLVQVHQRNLHFQGMIITDCSSVRDSKHSEPIKLPFFIWAVYPYHQPQKNILHDVWLRLKLQEEMLVEGWMVKCWNTHNSVLHYYYTRNSLWPFSMQRLRDVVITAMIMSYVQGNHRMDDEGVNQSGITPIIIIVIT